jgi:hypothetical protein
MGVLWCYCENNVVRVLEYQVLQCSSTDCRQDQYFDVLALQIHPLVVHFLFPVHSLT